MKITTHNFNLFFLCFCILWEIIHGYVINIDGAGRSIMMLSALAIIINNGNFKKAGAVFKSSVFIFWTLLVIYSIVNSYFKGTTSEYGPFHFFRSNYLDAFSFLLILIIELNEDVERCLKCLFGSFLTYVLIGSFFVETSVQGRLLNVLLGNRLALYSVCLFFLASVLYKGKSIHRILWLSVLAFCLIVIVLAATRKAFGAILIVLFCSLLDSKRVNTGMVFRLLLFVIAFYFGLSYIMDYMLLGERLKSVSDLSEFDLVSNPQINHFLNSFLGDRSAMYYYGMDLFHTNPITGIGIGHYIQTTGFENRLHTEYMVQLCENGIIGFSLFILFYISLIRALIRTRKKRSLQWITVDSGIMAILFLSFTTWTYNAQFVMVIYAVSFVYCFSNCAYFKKDKIKA